MDESDEETFTLALSDPVNASAADDASATVTITDDDARGVTVAPTTLEVEEGGDGAYTVVLASQPTGSVTVAVEGVTDEVTVDRESLTFTPQTWSDPQTVTVSVAEDPDAVEDAAVTLTHTAMGGDYTGLAVESVTVRSIEDDTATLSLADAAARENESAVTFTATLSVATSDTVTVSYATSDGTATAGADYTAGSGTLTFRPDEALTQTISVPILPDDLDEANETFTVTLSGVVNAALVGGGATATATGDDRGRRRDAGVDARSGESARG